MTAVILLTSSLPAWGSGNSVVIIDSSDVYLGVVGDSLAIGADGLPVVSYHFDTSADLRVAHCGDAACDAGNALTTVGSGVPVRYGSAITVGTDGLPVIVSTDANPPGLDVIHCGNASCTAGNREAGVGVNSGNAMDIAIGADELPVIAYEYGPTNDQSLLVIHCGNQACTAGNTLATVDSIDTRGLEVSIAIGTDGLPVISYVDFANGYLKIAHCGSVDCTLGNSLTVVDSASVGWYASIAIGSDGLPIVAYNVNSNGDVKVAHCGNAECTGANTSSVIQTQAANPSITIGADGLPILSYYTGHPGELRVAHCGNPACAAGNTLTSVDIVPSSSVGWWSSIAIGADGLPVMSHLDITNASLRFVHCSTVTCAETKFTPTPTEIASPVPTLTPRPVGGVSVDPQMGALPLEPSGSSGPGTDQFAIAVSAVVAGIMALTTAAWHRSRRRPQ